MPRGRLHEIKPAAPSCLRDSGGPMPRRSSKGLADGLISPEVDVREIYDNLYDA